MLYEAKEVYIKSDAESAMAANPDMKWYVARVASGCDAAFSRSLREHLMLRDLTSTVGMIISPTERVVSEKGRELLRPVYSGYIFILADMSPDLVHCVKSSSKSMGFVAQAGFNDTGMPSAMPRREVVDFVSKLPEVDEVSADGGDLAKVDGVDCKGILVGSSIVLDGGFSGVVKSINDATGDIVVVVEMFNNKTEVKTNAANVVDVKNWFKSFDKNC